MRSCRPRGVKLSGQSGDLGFELADTLVRRLRLGGLAGVDQL
jgi:hypothetical protein